LSAVYVNQTNLNVKLSTKLGGKQGATQPPLRTSTAHVSIFLILLEWRTLSIRL